MTSRNLERIAAILTVIGIVLLFLLPFRHPLVGAPFIVAAIVFWFWSGARKRKELLGSR